MWITNLAIRRPLVIVMAFLATALVGLLAYTKLPVDLFPKVNLPYVYITTAYPGASPQDVETFVTKPIEDAIAGVSGLINGILSMVEFNKGNTYAEFDSSVDKAAAYGLAGLIAGGILTKAGFFKGLLLLILGFKKAIAIGALAVVATFIGKLKSVLFGKKSG